MAGHETIHEYYLHQHSNIERYLAQCLENADTETVHDLRLSIKKLRAFNILAEKLCLTDTDEHIHFKHRVRRLYKLAGQLRDTQVQIPLHASFEEQTGKVYPEFSNWLLCREKKKVDRLGRKPHHVLTHATAHVTQAKIAQKLYRVSDEKILISASKVLNALLLKAGQLAVGTPDERSLHRIRIVSKKLRYIYNIVKHSFPDFEFSEISVQSLHEIEAATGHWHDTLIRVRLLERFLEKKQPFPKTELLKYGDLLSKYTEAEKIAYQEACLIVNREIPE